MVHAASAVALAVVALNAASTLALPSFYETAELMERDFDDFEVDARDFADTFEERDYLDQVEAPELLDSELDARDFEDMNAREIEQVFEYLRDVSSLSASAASTSAHPTSSAAALKTITVTSTYVPQPTSCTKKEWKHLKAEEKKALKALVKKEKEAAKKAKEAAKRAKKLLAKLKRKHHHHHSSASTTASATSTSGSHSVSATSTSASATASATGHHHHHHHHEFLEEHHRHHSHSSSSSVSATSTSVSHSGSATSTSVSASASASGHHHHHFMLASLFHKHKAHHAQITPAPQLHAILKTSTSTRTGHHGTVTVKVIATAPTPKCTKASSIKAREYSFDELD